MAAAALALVALAAAPGLPAAGPAVADFVVALYVLGAPGPGPAPPGLHDPALLRPLSWNDSRGGAWPLAQGVASPVLPPCVLDLARLGGPGEGPYWLHGWAFVQPEEGGPWRAVTLEDGLRVRPEALLYGASGVPSAQRWLAPAPLGFDRGAFTLDLRALGPAPAGTVDVVLRVPALPEAFVLPPGWPPEGLERPTTEQPALDLAAGPPLDAALCPPLPGGR